jgi:colanic acid/amylovoran biosynthesis glycosyltransferase
MDGRIPNIIFWSGMILTPSETFIRAQARNLKRFTPRFAGVRFVGDKSLIPREQCILINNGGAAGAIAEATFKATGAAPSMVRQLLLSRPALIHAHHGVNAALALPLARALGVPLVVTFYGRDATIRKSTQYASPTQWVFLRRAAQLKREAAVFIAVSSFIKRKLVERGYPAEKIIPHYYGVDTTEFLADPAVVREPVVLFVGRLAEKKGVEYLIRAMAPVQAALPHLRLVIVGDGPLRASLENQAARELRQCTFVGMQPSNVVKQWMNRASLFVAPSVTAKSGDSEGLPTVIVEAQAMGLPVVASEHAGISEAVTHGETGFLAPERDTAALTEHILRLCSNPALWSKFSVNGRLSVESKYDIRKQTRFLEDLYDRVLARPSLKPSANFSAMAG